jgi:hypothetical protein
MYPSPDCDSCGEKTIPIYYDYVDHAIIEKVILGFIYIADKYGLENFYCKNCKTKIRYGIIE